MSPDEQAERELMRLQLDTLLAVVAVALNAEQVEPTPPVRHPGTLKALERRQTDGSNVPIGQHWLKAS